MCNHDMDVSLPTHCYFLIFNAILEEVRYPGTNRLFKEICNASGVLIVFPAKKLSKNLKRRSLSLHVDDAKL